MSARAFSNVIAEVAFVGRSGGAIKTLSGFKKGHHTLPDAANAATSAFLGKICEAEIAGEAEALFQAIRAELKYKRRDLSLARSIGGATLQAKDFEVEIQYSLDETAPDKFVVTTTLTRLHDVELARSEAFDQVFAGKFSEISFAFKKGARVEAVIDALESLESESGLAVDYPSDYRECIVHVAGVDADVRCTSGSLNLVFPRAGSPAELIDGFAAVHEAFQINKVLSGLIG
jgi:hypothetical protein